jgi:hypothetical protein
MSRLMRFLLAIPFLFLPLCAAATTSVSVQPLSFDFGKQYLNKEYRAATFSITNTGTTQPAVISYTLSGPFRWSRGLVPQGVRPGSTMNVTIVFWPTVPGPATGSLVFNFNSGLPSITIPLSGTGEATNASISYSTKELVFSNQTVGSSSSQNLTLTNSGHSSLSVLQALVTPAVFSVSGGNFPIDVAPGNSTTLVVTYAPVAPGTQRGTVSFIFNNLAFSGVGVNGTATASTALTLATTSPIPGPATRGALYNYALSAAGGTPPYTWRLIGGSLPHGLTLNSQGVIAGTASQTASDTSFQVQVTDANFNVASGTISLFADAPTGADCSNINWDITGTTSPEIPMDQLGTNTYLGYMGGLYPGGTNTMPPAHQTAGINLANEIQPLNAEGQPSPTGKYVLLSLGTSDAAYEFDRFLEYSANEPTINSNLVIVEGAMGSEALDTLLGPEENDFWNNIYNWFLPDKGVTQQQVVAIWMEPEDAHPPGPFPQDMEQMHTELRTLIPNLLVRFPNLKLLYLASRAYAGYAKPPKQVTEPYSYDQAYALQAVIADQLNGDPALNFDPSQGPVVAPWLAWESYKWGNGMTAHNGLVWACQDFRNDGYHVTGPGEDKVVGLLMNFLKSDPTAAPWFYVPSTQKR